MRRLIVPGVLCALAVAGCAGTRTDVADTSVLPPAPSTTAMVSTTAPPTTDPTVQTDPTVPTGLTFPGPPAPVITAPVSTPRARRAAPPCDDPDGTHYCIRGTVPIDLTVTNSRFATFASSVRQTFVAMSDALGSVEVVFGGDGVGGFSVAPQGAMPSAVCASTVLTTETGVEVSRVDLVAPGTRGALEEVTVPLGAGLLPGARYAVELRVMPGCANRRFTTLVAMSSDWKYPAGSGTLTVDGRRSIGSLWARVD